MEPILSVVTPTLNASATLLDTLESVKALKQAGIAVEHIVVDGGSTDATMDIARSFVPVVDSILEVGPGLSEALNAGIQQARGRLVGILNADDIYLPAALEVLKSLELSGVEESVLLGDVVLFQDWPEAGEYRRADLNLMDRYMSVYHPSMWVGCDVYSACGPYRSDYEYAMDSEMVHRMMAANVTFRYLDSAVAAMRLGGKSHQNIWRALSEFRQSVCAHALQRPLVAHWFCLRQWLLHVILRAPAIRQTYLKWRSRTGSHPQHADV